MENSFFEYRDGAGNESDSETEIVDNSYVKSPSQIKKKNHTVYVAETDESITDDESDGDENIPKNISKSVITRNVTDNHIVASSDDDGSRRGSIRKQLYSSNKLVLRSSEDDGSRRDSIRRQSASSKKLVLNSSEDDGSRRGSIRKETASSNKVVLSSSEDDGSRRGSIRRESESSNKLDLSSSEDEGSRRGSMRRESDSSNKLVLSTSEDESVSPEIIPKRRPPMRQSILSNDSIIGRRTKKRMMLLDSDTENSIIMEHDKHKKWLCVKDTPLKTDSGVRHGNDSDGGDDDDGSDVGTDEDGDGNEDEITKCTDDEDEISNKNETNKNNNDKTADMDESAVYDTDDDGQGDDDEDDDDDHIVMSRATRMSIMGVIPKENDSDDSDFIVSDESQRKSGDSGGSLSGLPDVGLTPKPQEPLAEDLDSTRISCSPFSSPLRDITNKSINNAPYQSDNKDECIIIDEPKENISSGVKNKVQSYEKFIRYDDDVTIIDTKPEIIALSSDDEDVVKPEKAPKVKKSLKPKHEDLDVKPVSESIRQYLLPPSYPNQVVYVKKHVRENELTKLEALKDDLKNIRYLLQEMDVDTLPDGGGKLIERLTRLEEDVRRQGDKVASMVVEPDNPTALDIAKDGFGSEDKKGLSWDDIQKASNAVQPRMFGKQAMATHMAERNMIMDRLRDLYESLASRPAETELAEPPAGMTSQLMPHQLHALAWLQWRETQRPRAGILADDMGLGKTITMIALMVSDKEKRIDDDNDDDDEDHRTKGRMVSGGTLVVCPASLMAQWGGEVGKHCAAHALSVCLHHGAARAQQPHRLAAHDLVLTTYNILQRDNEKNGVLMRVRWRRAILDEAHVVRNHKSATAAAAAALRARRRWCLTGTPVQNKDLDLFALLNFLRCTPFDDLTMWKKWIDNKSLGGQERLSTIMRSILLRRTKAQLQQRGQLACLPARTAHERRVTLSKEEMNVYQKVLVFSKTLFAQFLHQRAEKNADGFTAPGKDSEYAKMHKKMIALQGAKPVKSHEILVLLLRLRQVCCHCGLIAAMLDEEGAGEVHEDAAGQDLLAELNKLSLEDSRSRNKSNNHEEEQEDAPEPESTTAAEAIRSVLSPNNPVFDLDSHSSKIQAVMDCLEENVFNNDGHKAVVVSQWTSVLRLVERRLRARRVRSVTLSGAVAVPARAPLIAAINDPNNDVKVMLLSLCAGGVGLNLCGANHLLLLDPHWNPQLEEQAQDRIYRVGQKKPVHIYRFMCVDTVEQTIRKLQKAKLELAENVLTGARNTNASKLTIEDLKMLFNMGPTPPVN